MQATPVAAGDRPAPQHKGGAGEQKEGVGARLLLVEDDAPVARVMEARLQSFGYEICSIAASGAAAVRSALEHRPDLILMDILLRGEMNGIEAAELIRRKMDVPIIFVTCLNDRSMLERAIKTNPYGYIRKPYDIAELKYAIRIALNQHRAAAGARMHQDAGGLEAQKRRAAINPAGAESRVSETHSAQSASVNANERSDIAPPGDLKEALSGIQLLLSLILKQNGNACAARAKEAEAGRDEQAVQLDCRMSQGFGGRAPGGGSGWCNGFLRVVKNIVKWHIEQFKLLS